MLNTSSAPGAPTFANLATPAFAESVRFYGAVFGWEFRPLSEDDEGYGYLCVEGKIVAGVSPVPAPGIPASWTVFFLTEDAAVSTKAVTAAGGTVLVEPFDGSTTARWAFCADVAGVPFALWEPVDGRGADLVGVPNSLGRVELLAPDRVAAREFYRSVFGWRGEEHVYPQGTYTALALADSGPDGGFGGISSLPADTHPLWLPHIEVDEPDEVLAAVLAHGGTAITPVADVPNVGRVAWVADPSGARFAIVRGLKP